MDIREKSKPLVYLVLASVAAVIALLFVMGDRLRPAATGQQTAAVEDTAAQGGEQAATAPATGEGGQQAAVETDQSSAAQQAAEGTGEMAGTAAEAEADEPAQATEAAGAASAAGAAGTGAEKPTFDIVRVEEDGAAVIAGQAPAGAKVTLRIGETIVGTAVANERGEWVVTPDKALPKGAHNLIIASEDAGGAVTYSDQVVSVAVPEDGDSQPLIVLSEAEQPSKVLQKPEQAGETEVAAVEPSQDAAQTAAEQPAAEAEQPATETAQPAAEAEQPAGETQQAAAEAAPKVVTAPLVMQAVDYNDSGDIVFSGTAAPGETVRVYVDNLYVGSAVADEFGNWAFRGKESITPGVHTLRIDQVRTDGKVAQRRELPFERAEPARVAELNQTQAATAGEPAAAEQQTGETASEPAQPESATAGTAIASADSSTQAEQATEPAGEQPAAATLQGATSEQAATVPGSGRVVIQPGNNLWNISRVIYGRGIEYSVIYEANKDQIRNPHRIYPGQIFSTPGVTPPEEIDPKRREPLEESGERG